MNMPDSVYYRIGDLVIRVDSDLPYPLPDFTAADFRVEPAAADYVFRFERTNSIPALTGKTKAVGECAFAFDMLNACGEHARGFYWQDGLYDAVLQMGEREGVISYVSNRIIAQRCCKGFDFINYYALEMLFLRHGGLLLHSSHLNVGGGALLFSAPSGTGKSTQADLWHEHAGAAIMNGDRTLLRRKDDVWTAYGCPMCGSSGIHRQGSEPLRAIVMLSQGKDNAVRRLNPGEAFSLIYPEMTIPKWSRELVLTAMDLIDDLLRSVPVYHFSCTKGPEAVEALRRETGL